MENIMAKVYDIMQMVVYIEEGGKTECEMDKGLRNGRMDRNTQDNTRMTKRMEMAI